MVRTTLVLVTLMIAGGVGFAADDTAQDQFNSFCAKWMQKLEVRERDNRAAIHWQAGPDGVQGEFLGYSHEHICRVKPPSGPGAVPIGKIVYNEVLYRHVGSSTAEALKSSPKPVEITEVTEIFRYSGGKWVY